MDWELRTIAEEAMSLFVMLGLLPWAPLVAGFVFGWRWEFLLPCGFWGLSWWGALAAALGRTKRAGQAGSG